MQVQRDRGDFRQHRSTSGGRRQRGKGHRLRTGTKTREGKQVAEQCCGSCDYAAGLIAPRPGRAAEITGGNHCLDLGDSRRKLADQGSCIRRRRCVAVILVCQIPPDIGIRSVTRERYLRAGGDYWDVEAYRQALRNAQCKSEWKVPDIGVSDRRELTYVEAIRCVTGQRPYCVFGARKGRKDVAAGGVDGEVCSQRLGGSV